MERRLRRATQVMSAGRPLGQRLETSPTRQPAVIMPLSECLLWDSNFGTSRGSIHFDFIGWLFCPQA